MNGTQLITHLELTETGHVKTFDTRPIAVTPTNVDELWDEHSQYVDDNLSSLEMIAGSIILTRGGFDEIIRKLKYNVE